MRCRGGGHTAQRACEVPRHAPATWAGKLRSGREAYEWGLINQCAPAEELDAVVDEFVADLADKSPFQMALTKMTLNRGLDADVDTLMLVERLAVGVTLNSNDAATRCPKRSRSACEVMTNTLPFGRTNWPTRPSRSRPTKTG